MNRKSTTFTMSTYNKLLDWVRNSPAGLWNDLGNNTLFYSGEIKILGERLHNGALASAWGERNRGQVLETTPAWGQLEQMVERAIIRGEINRDEQKSLWIEASKRYAEEADGHVQTFAINALPERVFVSHELPVLLDNQKVETINGVPREELAEVRDQQLLLTNDRTKAHEAVMDTLKEKARLEGELRIREKQIEYEREREQREREQKERERQQEELRRQQQESRTQSHSQSSSSDGKSVGSGSR